MKLSKNTDYLIYLVKQILFKCSFNEAVSKVTILDILASFISLSPIYTTMTIILNSPNRNNKILIE